MPNTKAFISTLPDFVEVQRTSFCWFLVYGLREELENFSTIFDFTKTTELHIFGQDYKIRQPKFTLLESKQRDGTYAVQIYVPMSLFVFKKNNRNRRINVLIGEIPLMTSRGTFIINGCERVVINQILRSPGVYYKEDVTRKGISIFTATLVPSRGSWLKFEFNAKKQVYIYLDKVEKISLLCFLQALGVTVEDLKSTLTYPDFFDSKTNLGESSEVLDTKIFDPKSYNIGFVGRYRLNKSFNLNLPPRVTTLTNHDFFAILDKLVRFNYEESKFDDIDHLENRRVRSVGELLQIQFRSGLTRLEKVLSERMTICDTNTLRVSNLVNPKPLISLMREFFGSSQLSQFLDQTNPLAELTHKRRISGLGPGGFSRDHVSFTVRDIHPSHYGRVCPIETPEGQNAGLIASLASYARVNSFGFIETPFFRVKNGQVLKDQPALYLTADEEGQYNVAPSDLVLDPDFKIQNQFVTVRSNQELLIVPRQSVDLISVATTQIVSAATALIPFLEHDDANRALMGSNMQRQAVPLLYPSKPIVGTGLESQLAVETGMVVISYRKGWVKYVDSTRVIISTELGELVHYPLYKFERSNQDTCINQRPIVWQYEWVEPGQILADGPGTDMGELALGQNILVAYMPWEGYNFEDALLINERLVFADLFTSIHIEKYDLEVRDTKIGLEQLSRDIPNVGKKALVNLDSNGIIKKGVFVTAGDILVGKITPREETDEIPEGRLLRAIFGEKNFGMLDNSLRVTNGSYGRVLDVRVFSRDNGDDLPAYTDSLVRVFLAQIRKIQVGDKIAGRHGNKGIISCILPRQDMPYLQDGSSIDLILNPLGVPSRMNVGQLFEGLFGLAGDRINTRFKIQPFDEMYGSEASRTLVNYTLRSAVVKSKNSWLLDFNAPGKLRLRDGRTGEFFDNPLSICKSYILKLVHLVDDKIHARSTGPYSLVTQQPLGGRSQQGGQRFGEMEVWALEAFGAAYTLQELLTIKSDDMPGRNLALNAIVKGEKIPRPGIPESFKVLILELQSLGLDIGTYQLCDLNIRQLNGIEVDLMEQTNQLNIDEIPLYNSLEIK